MRMRGLARISLGLAALTCSLFLVLDLTGFVPRTDHGIVRQRVQICEGMALQVASAIDQLDMRTIRAILNKTVRRPSRHSLLDLPARYKKAIKLFHIHATLSLMRR